jgi:ribosomal protein S18 acetylase RimI-like enzyme
VLTGAENSKLKKASNQFIIVEKVTAGSEIPFHLLLLADETVTAICKYLYTSHVFVAKIVSSKQVIGVFVLQMTNVKEIEIKNIAVDELYQGQGIGSFLIDKIKQLALQQGIQIVWVGTPDSATRQLNFYQKNGFRKAGVRKNFFRENYPEGIYENGKLLKDMVMLRIIFK